jgi:hypothetical protein
MRALKTRGSCGRLQYYRSAIPQIRRPFGFPALATGNVVVLKPAFRRSKMAHLLIPGARRRKHGPGDCGRAGRKDTLFRTPDHQVMVVRYTVNGDSLEPTSSAPTAGGNFGLGSPRDRLPLWAGQSANLSTCTDVLAFLTSLVGKVSSRGVAYRRS